MKAPLTAARLRELLAYDRGTGIFTWRVSRGRVKAGAVAGCDDGQGYVAITVDGVTYRAHCLAWLYETGSWARGVVDHKDTCRSHNWLDNLQDVTHSLNGLNRAGADCDSRTGVLGVSPSRGKFKASITVNKKTRMLGRFASCEQAEAAVVAARAAAMSGAATTPN